MRVTPLAALVLLLLAAPACAAERDDAAGGTARHAALVFTRAEAYRHTECIPEGTAAIRGLGARRGFRVDATDDPAAFRRRNLARYDVVVFLCTTGDVLARSSATSGRAAATPAPTPRRPRRRTGRGTAGSSARPSPTIPGSPA